MALRSQKAPGADNWFDFFIHTYLPKMHPNPARGGPGTPRPAAGALGWRFSPPPPTAAGRQPGLSGWDVTRQMLSPVSHPLTRTSALGLSPPGTRTHRLPDPGWVTRTQLPSLPATLSGKFRSKAEGTRRGHGFWALGCLIPN